MHKLVLLIILMTNSTLSYCWGNTCPLESKIDTFPTVKNVFKKSDNNLYKGYFSGQQKFTGNLQEFLNRFYDTAPDFVFSKDMDVVEDSIFIDLEFQKEFIHSAQFADLLLSSLQRAYSFRIRDTLLAELETVYVVSVFDKSRLEKMK